MVAYSFKSQFEMPIVSGFKLGTIRAVGRRRHAQPGDELQLYRGMRTKACRLIAIAKCCGNDAIEITPSRDLISVAEPGFSPLPTDMLDSFAQRDGFSDWGEMKKFWLAMHGEQTFLGRWIQWHPESVQVRL